MSKVNFLSMKPELDRRKMRLHWIMDRKGKCSGQVENGHLQRLKLQHFLLGCVEEKDRL